MSPAVGYSDILRVIWNLCMSLLRNSEDWEELLRGARPREDGWGGRAIDAVKTMETRGWRTGDLSYCRSQDVLVTAMSKGEEASVEDGK